MVGPTGPTTAKIAIVGEAPGEEEVKQGLPFVGPAGKVLDTALRQMGLLREECYLTNVMQERPPSNDFGAFYEDAGRRLPTPALWAGIARVKRELQQVKPNITLLCGAEPMRALLGLRDITARRGYLEMGEGLKMLPTYHPSAILHAPDERSFFPLFCFDIGKAKRESAYAELRLPHRSLVLRPTSEEALDLMAALQFEQQPITFDIETEKNGKAWHCIAFSNRSDWAVCIPTHPAWGVDAAYVQRVLPGIKALLEDATVPKVAQNAQFDILFLRHHYGIHTRGLIFDTMTAHHTVYPELPKSLELLASIYTDQPYYKDMEKIPPSLWEYNALDAAVTYECYQVLEEELTEIHNREFYQTYVLELIDPLLDMQERGVCVDQTKRGEVAVALQQEIDDNQAELTHTALAWKVVQQTPPDLASHHYVGLNPHSPKQLQEYLFTTLKLPTAYKRRTRAITTDEDTLERLSKRTAHPALPLILTLRGLQKLLSTYVLAPLGADGRMRCSYVVGGTDTGRLASRESMLGSGTNLQ